MVDYNYAGGVAWILAEPELEGRFVKYNNNAGAVRQARAAAAAGLREGARPAAASRFARAFDFL